MIKLKEQILSLFDPSRSIPMFIVGTAALTLVLQALYDWANAPNSFQGGYWLAIGAFILVVIILVVSQITARFQERSGGRIGIREEFKPGKRVGLVLLVGPTEASAPAAIEYHLPLLKHCWIVATMDSLKTASKLAERYRDQIPDIRYGSPDYLVHADQIQSTYDMVVRILDVEATELGLIGEQVVADITGGLKPMTAGMALACLARNYDMQYMKAPRDEAGQVIKGSIPEPIRIDTTFVPVPSLGGV